jgi:hypothetical protein
MENEQKYFNVSVNSIVGFSLEEASEQEIIPSIIEFIVCCFLTIGVWYNKVVFFYIVSCILCGD